MPTTVIRTIAPSCGVSIDGDETQRRAISIDFAGRIKQAHADGANRAAEINLDHLAKIVGRSVLWALLLDLDEFHLLGSQNDARRAPALAVVNRDAAKRAICKARAQAGGQHDRLSDEFGNHGSPGTQI